MKLHSTPATITLLAALCGFVIESVSLAADDPSLQLFATTNKRVVAVGEPFLVQLEAYVLLESDQTVADAVRAFSNVRLVDQSDGVVMVRGETARKSREMFAGAEAVRLTRRLVFRAEQPGRITLPSLEITWQEADYRYVPGIVHAYTMGVEFQRRARSIVPIVVERQDKATRSAYRRTGTAFFIAKDALVTSFHVVSDAKQVHVILPDGSPVEATRVWSIDPVRDVAVLYMDSGIVEKAGVVPLPLASLPPPEVTADEQVVFTNGWPGGLRRSTAGIRYAGARLGYDRAWISSNPVGPGDSGGPLLSSNGEVLGVVTLGTITSGGPDVLREHVCISNDLRPALGLKNTALGPISMKSAFEQDGFRSRPYVQAFRLLAMISNQERFDQSLRSALAEFEASIGDRHADPGIHFMRGVLYRMLGTNHEANASFKEVLNLFEEFFPAAYILGLHRLQSAQYEEAIALFEQTRRVEPYQFLAAYGLARARMRLHHYDEAVSLLNDVLDYDPYYAPALFNQALCYLALGRTRSASLNEIRLSHVSRSWQLELARVRRTAVLRPRIVEEMPRARFFLTPEE